MVLRQAQATFSAGGAAGSQARRRRCAGAAGTAGGGEGSSLGRWAVVGWAALGARDRIRWREGVKGAQDAEPALGPVHERYRDSDRDDLIGRAGAQRWRRPWC